MAFADDYPTNPAKDIDAAFVEQYNADVHHLFDQYGPRLVGMSRKGTVMGKSAIFQRMGSVTVTDKPRRGTHSFGAPDHDNVSCPMVDKYVPTAVDKLDLLKTNIDERRAHAKVHVGAVSKWIDNMLVGTLEATTQADIGSATHGFGYGHAMRIVNGFTINDVPDDGERYCAMHPYAWSQFLQVPEFANADYVGSEDLPFKGGMSAKRWMGVLWFPLNNITLAPGNLARNVAWHRSILGHGVNAEMETVWSYENTMSAYAAVSSVSMGAVLIEDKGAFLSTSLSPQPVIA